MSREPRIRGTGGQKFLIRWDRSGDATGWVIFDLATRDCLSGCHVSLAAAYADCDKIAARRAVALA